MAGCCVVMMALVGCLLIAAALILFLGLLGGAAVTLIISVVLLIVLTKTGVFERYLNSEVTWHKVVAHIIRGVLIFFIAISSLLLIAGIVILILFGTSPDETIRNSALVISYLCG